MDRRKGRLTRLAVNFATAVSACWAGCWLTFREKPLPPGLPPLYYDPFVRELVRHGRYVLPCGGGVIAEPQRAIDELQGRYGQAGLCERCFTLMFEQSADAEYPEGIGNTAMGILCRLGDRLTLQKLMGLRHRLLQTETGTNPAEMWQRGNMPPDRCDWLIAALCHRLHQPLPDGVAPLTDDDVFRFPD
jgi:hypothetical protein